MAQASLVRQGEVTATELVTWAIERIERLNPTLNAVITPMYEQALAAAATLTTAPARCRGCRSWSRTSSPRSPGFRSARDPASCAAWSPTSDCELVRRLQRAGLIIVGKTNTPEFGMAPTCEPGRVRPHPQPVGHHQFDQRIQRRLGRRGRVADGADRARQRPRRLAALPRLGLRAVRAQAHPRPQPARSRVRGRGQRLGLRARADPHRPRQRRAARRHRRSRTR